MFFRVVACCIGFTATFVLSAFSGPFDNYVGKYKGRRVERGSDGSTYYFTQTVKLDGDSHVTTASMPNVGTVRESIRFRPNGTLRGSGSLLGYGLSWTVTGKWRQEGDIIKGRNTSYYSDGSMTSERFSLRLQSGKLVSTSSGASSDGRTFVTSYTGKLLESPQ